MIYDTTVERREATVDFDYALTDCRLDDEPQVPPLNAAWSLA